MPGDMSIDEKATESYRDTPMTLDKPTASHEDVEQLPPIGHAAETRLVAKLDFYIIPPTMLLYLFSFLDRVNIGNAKLYGMEEDLGINSTQYSTAVSLLFLTYILCETPSNLMLKKLRPSRFISCITVCWAVVATLSGLVQNYGGLIACRLILGALEAGLFPGKLSGPRPGPCSSNSCSS
jgi:MFS family permease